MRNIDLKPEQSKIVLSVKEKERIENQEALKNLVKRKISGQSLKSIFVKFLVQEKVKKDKEDK